MRKTLPVIVAFLSGFFMILAFFFNTQRIYLGDIEGELLAWVTIVGGFTLFLGVVSITRVNWSAVTLRKPGWFFNLLVVISVFVLAVPAMFPSSWSPLFGRAPGSIYDWGFTYLSQPMMATMFAMLAFYIASAAYRAFRARNTEATLLLITATLVMLWRIPMGDSFLRLFSDNLPGWINTYVMSGFNLSVQRGIIIGAALGAASMSLRILLGIERTYMGKS
jgi:hypothetical protein